MSRRKNTRHTVIQIFVSRKVWILKHGTYSGTPGRKKHPKWAVICLPPRQTWSLFCVKLSFWKKRIIDDLHNAVTELAGIHFCTVCKMAKYRVWDWKAWSKSCDFEISIIWFLLSRECVECGDPGRRFCEIMAMYMCAVGCLCKKSPLYFCFKFLVSFTVCANKVSVSDYDSKYDSEIVITKSGWF